MPTLEYERLHRCVVFVCEDGPLDDGEWERYLAYFAGCCKPGVSNRSLVFAKGSLSSLQRKKVAEVIAPLRGSLKSAVISDSALVRGAVTALEWFSRDVFKIFAPNDLDRALEFLDLRGKEASEIKELVLSLQEKLALGSTSAA